mgnify:CR=1 FL=1
MRVQWGLCAGGASDNGSSGAHSTVVKLTKKTSDDSSRMETEAARATAPMASTPSLAEIVK